MWSAVIQQYLQEIVTSSGGILRQRLLLAGENSNFKHITFVLVMVSLSKGEKKEHLSKLGKKTFLRSDRDGSQDVPTEWKLIRWDV